MDEKMSAYAIANFNSVGQITISTEEYKALVKIWAATEAFVSFVKGSGRYIDKEDCARFLGFELPEDNDE